MALFIEQKQHSLVKCRFCNCSFTDRHTIYYVYGSYLITIIKDKKGKIVKKTRTLWKWTGRNDKFWTSPFCICGTCHNHTDGFASKKITLRKLRKMLIIWELEK